MYSAYGMGLSSLFLFFSQKTAYEVRISDWSSDVCSSDLGSFGGLALAYNARDPAAVDAVLVEAEAAGGTILKPAGATAWGGYAGYFADPDGHPWEGSEERRVGKACVITFRARWSRYH